MNDAADRTRSLAAQVRSAAADFDIALAAYAQGVGCDRVTLINLGEKLSDLAGDLARSVDPEE